MATRSNKVNTVRGIPKRPTADERDRNIDSMDGVKWHRHGLELPGSGGLHCDMVSLGKGFERRSATTQDLGALSAGEADHLNYREFVSQVQQHLLSLGGPGTP